MAGLLRWDCAAEIKPFLSFLPSPFSSEVSFPARTTAPNLDRPTDRPTQVSPVSFGAAIISACVRAPWHQPSNILLAF